MRGSANPRLAHSSAQAGRHQHVAHREREAPGVAASPPASEAVHRMSHFAHLAEVPSRPGGAGNPPEYTDPVSVLDAKRHREDLVEELIAEVESYNPDVDKDLLRRAFEAAERAHAGQTRRSGEEFIHHPLGVARICAELHLDEQTIAAALLHDVLEDTEFDLDDLRAEFGPDVAQLVEGVTKLTRISFQSREQAEAENYRKMIVAMAQDVRVILIKLADRLHNMRTIEYLGKQKQAQKARETLEVYAPLAHRLGIHALKWELEDLAFQTLHPRKYAEIKAMVADRRADRETQADKAAEILGDELT
jgi:guanosine-3',5'-bis(diphosphate) 3'-pyrophosphohydrolase